MSAVVTGLVGAVVATALIALAERTQRPATASPDGWKALRPGWLIGFTIVGCTAFAALMGYFLWAGGSALPDAATQNGFAMLLLAACAAGAVYTAWTTYGRTVAWKGNELRVRSVSGGESVRRLSDAVKVVKSDMLGAYRITFRDGSKLLAVRLSEWRRGADRKAAAPRLPRPTLTSAPSRRTSRGARIG